VTAGAATVERERRRLVDWRRLVNRHGWTVGVYVILLGAFLYWQSLVTNFSSFDVQTLALDIVPLAFAAMAQAVVVISGGIDLTVGSLMSFASVVSGRYMVHMSYREALLFAALMILGGALAGAFTGLLITVSRVPDIVVTLALLFVWQGVALKILSTPGGGAPLDFIKLGQGYTGSQWIPTGLVVTLAAFAVVWLPLRWTKPGLAIYAVGSNRNAAYLSGISVARARILAYALSGVFATLGGIALTTIATQGNPIGGTNYTLQSVAAIVLGGVALVGGKGGLIGPIGAAVILILIKNILVLKGFDQNYVQVIQGTIIVVIVVLGALVTLQRGRHAA
jgi:ribose transport system permease protein